MQESKHTPTPWIFLNSGTAVNEPDGWCIFTPLWPGTPGTHDEKMAEKKANAVFIVRAVNNHQALVEALRMCVGRMDGEYGFDGPEIDAARAALAALD